MHILQNFKAQCFNLYKSLFLAQSFNPPKNYAITHIVLFMLFLAVYKLFRYHFIPKGIFTDKAMFLPGLKYPTSFKVDKWSTYFLSKILFALNPMANF